MFFHLRGTHLQYYVYVACFSINKQSYTDGKTFLSLVSGYYLFFAEAQLVY